MRGQSRLIKIGHDTRQVAPRWHNKNGRPAYKAIVIISNNFPPGMKTFGALDLETSMKDAAFMPIARLRRIPS